MRKLIAVVTVLLVVACVVAGCAPLRSDDSYDKAGVSAASQVK
jgi:hypothetical protein